MRPRILIVSQAGQLTGLARVSRGMAASLAVHCDMHVLGIDCDGSQRGAGPGWTLHANPRRHDPFAELRLPELMDSLRPDAVLLYNDLGVIDRYFPRLDQAAHRCAVLGYCPVDGNVIQPCAVSALPRLDALVVFTRFARATVRQAALRAGVGQAPVFEDMRVIAHGLDLQDFHPLPGPDDLRRLNARRSLFPEQPACWSGFWVLNANRNQPRKRLDLTMEGFALFAQDKGDDVRLYLHTGTRETGIDIARHAAVLGIEGRLLMTRRDGEHPELASSGLNLVYNACDVGVNTAIGEGWGLVSCEHAATRAAQVAPRHSACAELWDGAAELMAPVRTVCAGLLDGQEIDPAALADKLELLYRDHGHRQRMAQAAYQRATSPAWGWPQVARVWLSLFNQAIQRRQAATS